jgi:capsular polysaccharide biosynthesis protein/Flp pilus assembly protein TadD
MVDPAIARLDLKRLLDRAAACRDQGDATGAIASDRSAILLEPQSAVAYASLAQSLQMAGRLAAARRSWERAIATGLAGGTQAEALARWELGQLLWQLGEQNAAIAQLLQVAALDPAVMSLQTLEDLSRWLRRRDRQAAARQLDQALVAALVPSVRQMMRQGDWSAAVRWCLRSLHIAPADDAPYNLLFDALNGLGRPEQARDCFCRLIPPELLAEFAPTSEPIATTALATDAATGVTIALDRPGPTPYELPAARSILPDRPLGTFPVLSPLCEPPRQLVAIEQGRAWVDTYNRVIWNRSGAMLEGLGIGVDRLIAASDRLPPPTPITGNVAVIAKQHTANYFHWVVEFLPQVVDLLTYCDQTGQAIDYWYFDGRSLPFQVDSLAALGIPPDRCLASEQLPHIQADRLWVFNTASLIEGCRSSLQNLRDRLLPQPPTQPWRRLYLSRSQSRRIVNEPELQPLLDRWGFETVPEGLSFTEQVALFSEAQWVLGPHGAAFTNTLFCAPGTRILEWFAPSYVSHFYWRLSGQIQLSYRYLIGDAVAIGDDPLVQKLSQSMGFYQDLTVPLAEAQRAIAHWFALPS